MKKKIFTVIAISLFLLLGNVTGQELRSKIKTEDLKAQVQTINDKVARANVAGDMEAIYSVYADDIVYMPNYAPMIRGKEAMRKMDKEMEETGAKIISMTLTTLEVSDMGGMVYEIGTYGMAMELPGTQSPWADKGKYVSIYRKLKDGSLEMVVDIWNTDTNPWERMQEKDKSE
jgi:ketosteroid isomerase-like protein